MSKSKKEPTLAQIEAENGVDNQIGIIELRLGKLTSQFQALDKHVSQPRSDSRRNKQQNARRSSERSESNWKEPTKR